MTQGLDQSGRLPADALSPTKPSMRQMLESLGVRVVGAGLSVDEPEEPLASRAEEVVATVERHVVERRHVGGTLQNGGEGLPGVSAQVDDGLTGVEAFDEQHVCPRTEELTLRGLRSDVDAEDPVFGVGVMDHVEWPVPSGDDRRVVDDRGSIDLDERAISRSGH